ncbi:adenylyl-sulfate kinase [Streptomyces sp. NP160]|uniref:AAA family ATPase n=1 Tax=Streptomyces sp. NP160 TaxID=2586637 RepID=UPI001118331C|nr:AAA family ATPase [Streptomyces sp. NP160]TNM64117.1 adenylyl-sulfate kinase [Streptomyces sp. NP160]
MSVLVVIAGPQASGKSTVASALGERLREQGEVVAVVELDALAAMALPTLPGWDVAHRVYEVVTGLWLRSGTTCVIAEGGGSQAEVDRVVRQAPAGTAVLTVGTTTSAAVAHERAQADPTRGLSRQLDFLTGVYDSWAGELDRIAPDVVLDTTASTVEECVASLAREVGRRRGAPVAPGP